MIFDANTLPSRTIPYQVKQINVNPFRPKQLAHLSRAIYLESMAPAIVAMQEVCDFDVNLMTPGDFYFFLTWQRFNCLKRSVSAKWQCGGLAYKREGTGEVYTVERITQVVNNWKAAEGLPEQSKLEDPNKIKFNVEACHCVNEKSITFADFETVFLADEKLDPRLDYPRVMHMVEYNELIGDPVYGKIAGPARWVLEGKTLKDKIDILFAQEDMDLFEAAANADANNVHGVSRLVKLQCDVCGSFHTFQTTIDPASFFL